MRTKVMTQAQLATKLMEQCEANRAIGYKATAYCFYVVARMAHEGSTYQECSDAAVHNRDHCDKSDHTPHYHAWDTVCEWLERHRA